MQGPSGAPPLSARLVGRRRTPRLHILIAAIVVALDQATKAWAVEALDDGPIELVGDTVKLDLVRNRGGAFSIFSFEGVTPFLALAALGLSVWLVYLGRREEDRWLGFGLALVLGGALGNLCDRLFRAPGVLKGAVVDFVDVGAWPTFNLADAAISVGVVVLVLRGWGRDDGHDAGEREGTTGDHAAVDDDDRHDG